MCNWAVHEYHEEDLESTTSMAAHEDSSTESESDTSPFTAVAPAQNLAQRKTAAVVATMLQDCVRLLSNFSQNYTGGQTRNQCAETQKPNRNHAHPLETCEPVIYGGAAYGILHEALATNSRIGAPVPEPQFRPTTDIDVKVPFPSPKSKSGWDQFTHKSAARALRVAQDRVLELAELLNMSCTAHVDTLSAQGIDLHNQQALRKKGRIDCNSLQMLARKRPSSRFDLVLPMEGGWGPFFASSTFNEHACFYTFKVCYVWSAEDLFMGEPQYAELIEFQMVPQDVASSPSRKAGLSLHLHTASTQPFDLRCDASSSATTLRGQGCVCIEEPLALADASARAVANRLSRGCHNDGDWEKVLTDEQRAIWLQAVSRSSALTRLGMPSAASYDLACMCQSVLDLREEDLVWL